VEHFFRLHEQLRCRAEVVLKKKNLVKQLLMVNSRGSWEKLIFSASSTSTHHMRAGFKRLYLRSYFILTRLVKKNSFKQILKLLCNKQIQTKRPTPHWAVLRACAQTHGGKRNNEIASKRLMALRACLVGRLVSRFLSKHQSWTLGNQNW